MLDAKDKVSYHNGGLQILVSVICPNKTSLFRPTGPNQAGDENLNRSFLDPKRCKTPL